MGTLVEQLRQLRESTGFTQDTIAARIGVKRPHVSNVESGRRGVSIHVLERYVEACGRRLEIVDPNAPRLPDLALRLGALLPELPEAILQDLEERIAAWERRYGRAP